MECLRCNGTGEVVTCPDDMCFGQEECIHGDGYSDCPTCGGLGYVEHSEDAEDEESVPPEIADGVYDWQFGRGVNL